MVHCRDCEMVVFVGQNEALVLVSVLDIGRLNTPLLLDISRLGTPQRVP
jgi:hypothetical protein